LQGAREEIYSAPEPPHIFSNKTFPFDDFIPATKTTLSNFLTNAGN
jgi:hypothetical protein